VPEIRVFKKPISPESFIPIYPDPFRSEHNPREPDLILKLNSGKVSIYVPIQKDEPRVSKISVSHSNMDVSIQHRSGAIVSVEDLNECQGIVSLMAPRAEFHQLWRTAKSQSLTRHVNGQPIAQASDSNLSRRRRVSPLTRTLTSGPLSQRLVYVFTFLTPSPAEDKH
jgi:hypothetical protein